MRNKRARHAQDGFLSCFLDNILLSARAGIFLRNKADNGRLAEQCSRRRFLGHPLHADLQGLQGFAGAVYAFFFMPCWTKRFSICTGLTDTPFAEIVWASSGKSASGCLIYSASI